MACFELAIVKRIICHNGCIYDINFYWILYQIIIRASYLIVSLKYFQILTSRQTISTLRLHHLIRQYEYGSCQEVFVLELYMESPHSFVYVFTL